MELDLKVALEIVLDLAKQNMLDSMDCDDELVYHAKMQDEAINVMEAHMDDLDN